MQSLENVSTPSRLGYFVKSLYYDPFRWSLLKSAAIFFIGVRVAREFKGFELMPAQAMSAGP